MFRSIRTASLVLFLAGPLAAWTPALAAGSEQTAALGQPALPSELPLGSVQLRDPAVVSGAVVTLGDLFTGLPADQAETPIARAPQLGQSVPVDAAWLGRLAKHYEVDWQPRSHLDGTVVEHKAVVVGAGEVEVELARLFDDLAGGDDLEVSVDNRSLSVALPLESDGRFGLQDLRRDERSGRFTVTLVYPAEGQPSVSVPLSGRVVELVEVPVLLRRVGGDEIIRPADIGWEKRRADRLTGNLITDPSRIVGLSPKRGLRAGEPVRAADLQAPILVPRNSLVTLRLKADNMTLTAQGKALDEGSAGSVVRVVNLKSNTIVQAVVSAAGVVDVAAAQRVLTN